jgi:hypothetical protein
LDASPWSHIVLGPATVIRERFRTNHLPVNSQPFARLTFLLFAVVALENVIHPAGIPAE